MPAYAVKPQAGRDAAALFTGGSVAARPRPQLEVWEWAEEHVILPPAVTPYPGPLSFRRTPYCQGEWSPLWARRRYRETALIWAAQTAKTTVLYTVLAYDVATDPGPGMVVYPDQVTARRRSKRHVMPIIRASLPQYLTGSEDDLQLLEYTLATCSWVLAWAGSPSVLAGEPIKHLLLDELGKFQGGTEKEADAESNAKRRLTAFGEFGSVVSATTPTLADQPGWRNWERLDGSGNVTWRSTRCEYWVPCPACGHEQVMYFGREDRRWFGHDDRDEWPGGIRWDKDESLTREQRTDSAYYQCERCPAHWGDAAKNEAVRRGQWKPRHPEARQYACHLASWYAPWVKFGDVVDRWFRAYRNEDGRHDFLNSDCAVPYELSGRGTDNDLLRKRMFPGHRSGRVPTGVRWLMLSADVHDDHIRYRVRGWAPDLLTSWGILEGELPPHLAALDSVLLRQFPAPDGATRQVVFGVIDSGYRADEVYQYCLRWPGSLWPIKGGIAGDALRYSRTYVYADPDKGQTMAGELTLVLFDDARWKDQLFQRLAINSGDSGAWYIEEDVTATYLHQMAGEVKAVAKDRRGHPRAEWRQLHDNHALDCEKYQLIAAALFAPYAGISAAPEPARPSAETVVNPYTGKEVV